MKTNKKCRVSPLGVALVAVFYCVLASDRCRSEPIAIPYNLLPGEKYRVAFVTSEEHGASSSDINVYNDFVTGVAQMEPALVNLGATWSVIGSTDVVDARTNTNTDPNVNVGQPIYLLDGFTKIADDNADLWDGDVDNPLNIQQNGEIRDSGLSSVNTGTFIDGTQGFALGHVSEVVTTGLFNLSNGAWIDSNTANGGTQQDSRPFYALSSELTVPRATPPAGAQGTTTRIVIEDDPAADGNGTLNGLDSFPVLNDQSQVLYTAAYVNTSGGPDDQYAAVRYDDGVHTQVLRSGTTAPDGNGDLGRFYIPKLNNNGSSAYYANFGDTAGGIADDQGIIVVDDSGAHIIIREGDTAPNGNGEYYILNANDFPPLAFNDLDQVAVLNELVNTAGGLVDDRSVVRGSPVALLELAREGDPTPAGPGDYGSFGLPVINHSGAVAFRANNISGLTPGSDAQAAIIRQQGTVAIEIVRAGQPAPDGNGVINPFGLADDLAINEAGEVAFAASFKNTSGGSSDAFAMIRGDGDSQHIVARAGDAAPDGNGTIEAAFHAFGPPKLSEFGEVAFRTEYDGTAQFSLDDSAIVKAYANDTGREIVEVVREGWSLPGGDGEFSNVADPIDMNEVGVVVFTNGLRNLSGDTSTGRGIFLGDGIDIVEVTRTDASIDGYTVFQVAIDGYGIAEGSLNRHGQVAFSAEVRHPIPVFLSDAVYLFTPDLYWRGGTIGAWAEHRVQLGDVNDYAMKNWTLSLTPAAVHDVIVDRNRATAFGTATPLVEITGPNADVTVKSLELREATHLTLIGDHTFTAINGTVLDAGKLSGSGELVGAVEIIAGGALEADGMTVEGDVVNDGLLGVVAAASDFGVFNGAITNNGLAVIDNENAIASTGTFNGEFVNNGQLIVGANQTAEFVGDYRGGGGISNDGTIVFHALGPGASPAHVEIQGAGAVELAAVGVTTIEIGGTERGGFHGDPSAQYDSISVPGGVLTLDGTLEVELISPDGIASIFSPDPGDSFTILTAANVIGTFDTLALPALDGVLLMDVTYHSDRVMLMVVPEPSSLTLLAIVAAWFVRPETGARIRRANGRR